MADGSKSTFEGLFTSGGILFAGMIIQLGLGFLARAAIARFLGRVNYGAVAIGFTLLTAASILAVVGTDTGIGRYLPRFDDPNRRRGVLLSSFQMVVPLSMVAGVAVVLLANPIAVYAFKDPEIAPVIRVFGGAIPFAAFVRLTIGSVRGMQQSLPKVYIQNIALPVVRFVLIAVVLVLGFQSVGVAWAYAGAYFVTAALSLYYLVRYTPLFDRIDPSPMRRELLLFSAPLMVTATMNMVFQNLDTFMLGFFATTGDVGVYNVAYPIATLLTVALTAFGFTFMPKISEFHSNGESAEMRGTYQIVSKWILFATLPLFLVIAFFPTVIIRSTFGPEYVAGGFALTVLAAGFFTHAVTGPSGNVLTAIGKSRTIMYDNTSVALLNAALNVVLIPRYSILGAAVATTIGYSLMNGLYLVQMYRAAGIHPFRRAMLGPGIATVVLWAALFWVLRSVTSAAGTALLVEVGAFVVLYPVVLLRFGGVEPEDARLANTIEQRLGLDLGPVRSLAKRVAN